MLLAFWFSLFASKTSWVQQLNSVILSQKWQLRKVPDSYSSCLIQFREFHSLPQNSFPLFRDEGKHFPRYSLRREPRLAPRAVPSYSKLSSGISVYFGALNDSVSPGLEFMSTLLLVMPGALSSGLHVENFKEGEGRAFLNLGKESEHILLISGSGETLCLEGLWPVGIDGLCLLSK